MKKLILTSIVILLALISSDFSAKENRTRIDILYFHATMRCHSCITIEDFTRKSLSLLFEKQLKDSSLTITSIDFQEPENEHFPEDYGFETQTLIISMKVNGKEVKWKNLEKVWDYLADFEKYKNYIEKEVKQFLKSKKTWRKK